jgi:hypothetical protein
MSTPYAYWLPEYFAPTYFAPLESEPGASGCVLEQDTGPATLAATAAVAGPSGATLAATAGPATVALLAEAPLGQVAVGTLAATAGPATVRAEATSARATDWDILGDARDRLVATGAFDGVYRSAAPEDRGRKSADRYAAVVSAASWEEVDPYDDEREVQSERRVAWTLTLIARDDDPELREKALARLLAVAQDALDGVALGPGITIPGWTRLRKGRYLPAEPPEQRMAVSGEFAYWVEGYAGHDAGDG